MMLSLIALLPLASPTPLQSDAAPPSGTPLVLAGARVLAPGGERWLDGRAVLVREGRIVRIAPVSELGLEGSETVLDLDGLHLVPGLIDLHTHLFLHPYDEASWDDQVLREPLALRTARAVAAAKATLEAGFTTVRELGTEGAGWADAGLRDAILQGIAPGPRILAATRALVATGSYGPAGFDPRWEIPVGAQVADGEGLRAAVREQIAAGADWIKVYADYRRRPGAPAAPTYSLDELRLAVEEAEAAGVPLAAHASTDVAIRRAVLAGARTIEHGTGASRETLLLMRQKGAVLCPTLAAAEAIARYGGWRPGEPESPRLSEAREMLARALEAGVTVACGSDAGVFAHGDNAREIELLVDFGMAPADALRAATSVAAKALGRDADLGRIAPGLIADLAAFECDPLADPSALRRPRLVVQQGRVACDRLAEPSAELRAELAGLCERMLAAYSERRFDETAAMFPPGAVVALDSRASGRRATLPAAEFLDRARAGLAEVDTFVERLSGEPRVLADGAIATVWAPFVLEADGRFATGTDVFQLVRLDEGWRIASLSFTNRAR